MAGILKQQLLKELDRRFGEQGFKRISDRFYGDRYDRAISGGRQSIALASHTRKTTLVLDPAFASIRLDEVETEVFRFEQKNELLNEHDAFQRCTIGKRLDKHELLKIATGRYAISNPDDCQRVGENYTRDMLSMAEQFWKAAANASAILAILADVPGSAREYAGTDFIAAIRAIVLTRIVRGEAEARLFADGVLTRLTGDQKLELSQWTARALDAWSSVSQDK